MPGEVERHCLVAQLPVAHPLPIGVLGRNHRQSGGFTLSAVEASLIRSTTREGFRGLPIRGAEAKSRGSWHPGLSSEWGLRPSHLPCSLRGCRALIDRA